MASYVSKILGGDETVVLKAKLHWIGYVPSLVWLVLAAVLVAASDEPAPKILIATAAVPIVLGSFLWFWIARWTTELVVTDRRVVAKTGLISRHTNEINRAKIEGVDVRQTVLGRLLNFGTVSVRGTGGAIAPIPRIWDPLGFRKAVHAE